LRVGIRTIEGLRQRLVEQGLEAALERKKRAEPPVPRKPDGEQEARLVAVCCSQAAEGRRRWTLHLLADRLVELRIIDSISHETVRQTLLKTS
jgi:transposase